MGQRPEMYGHHGKIYQEIQTRDRLAQEGLLVHKGLDRCPDKGYAHFKRYVGLGVCAYNLHRIGAELMRQAREELHRKAA